MQVFSQSDDRFPATNETDLDQKFIKSDDPNARAVASEGGIAR